MRRRQQQQRGRERKTCCSRILDCASSLFYIGSLCVIAWIMFGRPSRQEAMDAINHVINNWNASDFTNVLDNLTDTFWDNGFNEDPFEGMRGGYGYGDDGEVSGNNSTMMIWESATKDGLSLLLLNALDSSWQNEFANAVSDWSKSNVLDLRTKIVDVDNSCERVDGVMKVCNGNYGNTGWVGINEVEMVYYHRNDPGKIISSVAKMNEYYLNHAEYTKRRYTMCHEIGHGFGLPHTDENFHNTDLGNCLDYTNTPENNIHPGQVNMDRLEYMYGDGGPTLAPTNKPTAVPSTGPSSIPSVIPSILPSNIPSSIPSGVPSFVPTDVPSVAPSNKPTSVPSTGPSLLPSVIPSGLPSSIPSSAPSGVPSYVPTGVPSVVPSNKPSAVPSTGPSSLPSVVPSVKQRRHTRARRYHHRVIVRRFLPVPPSHYDDSDNQ